MDNNQSKFITNIVRSFKGRGDSTVGRIVKHENGKKYVIVYFNNREDTDSCGYGNSYILTPYKEEVDLFEVTLNDDLNIRVHVHNNSIPFEILENVLKYEFNSLKIIDLNLYLMFERDFSLIPTR